MKLFVTILFALAVFTVVAQPDTKQQTISLDSNTKKLNNAMSVMQQRLDSLESENIKKQAQRSGEMLLQWHNERQAKQKKQMFLYLGMGIFFLVMLVVGLMRRGKKNQQR